MGPQCTVFIFSWSYSPAARPVSGPSFAVHAQAGMTLGALDLGLCAVQQRGVLTAYLMTRRHPPSDRRVLFSPRQESVGSPLGAFRFQGSRAPENR